MQIWKTIIPTVSNNENFNAYRSKSFFIFFSIAWNAIIAGLLLVVNKCVFFPRGVDFLRSISIYTNAPMNGCSWYFDFVWH